MEPDQMNRSFQKTKINETSIRDLAPDIYRQRLIIEGIYQTDIDETVIIEYFDLILSSLNLRSASNPVVNSSEGLGKKINQGYEAFIPLIDSGIVLYTWTSNSFLSIIIFTCKKFSEDKAIKETRDFFQLNLIEFHSF